MSNLTPRNINILKIIVQEFIQTWDVLWSKALLKKYDLWVSPATVRNDMATLENLELIYQPYASAWRLPTAKWLRAFISYLMQQTPNHFLENKWVNFKHNDIKTFEKSNNCNFERLQELNCVYRCHNPLKIQIVNIIILRHIFPL